MRPVPLIAAVLLVASACSPDAPIDVPLVDRFYFPTGVAHVSSEGGPGILYVASSNFDKRYDRGQVTAVDLNALEWPDPGAAGLDLKSPWYLTPGGASGPLPQRPVELTNLGIDESQRVLISPFAGMMDHFRLSDGRTRLFVPSRSEQDFFFGIDAEGARLTCARGGGSDCVSDEAMSLTADAINQTEGFVDGKPRAPEPFGVAVRQRCDVVPPAGANWSCVPGQVYVTHMQPADSPLDSTDNRESYTVQLNAEELTLAPSSFIPIGVSPSFMVAVGQRYAYVTGRAFSQNQAPPTLRLVERALDGTPRVLASELQQDFKLFDARSIALSADEKRIFLVGRAPDVLLTITQENPLADRPRVQLTGAVPLPQGPNDLKAIDRGPGRGVLLAITSSTAGTLAIYDDETGQLVTVVEGVGAQPFGIAVQRPAGAQGARLFVTNFGDGRVAVVDIPDVNQPHTAVIAAHLGEKQVCLTEEQGAPSCEEVAQ